MRVLTIVRNFGQRGTQRVAESFSCAYRRLHHNVAVLAFENEGPRLPRYLEHGVVLLPPYKTAPEEALRQARTFKPDLIHIHRSGVTQPNETQLLSELKNQNNCVLETNVFSRFDRHADRYIDLHAQLTRAGLYRWLKLENGRSQGVGFYLPNLLDYDTWRAPSREHAQRLRHNLNIPPEAVVLGTIGKAHRGLGRVVAQVLSGRRGVHWLAVDNDETRRLFQQLPRPIQAHCRLLPGTDSDEILTHHYSLFDLLLHWSPNGESFGMVLAESIAVGTPIVMPLQSHRDIGGVEVVGHEQGGFIAGCSRNLGYTCQLAIDQLPLLRERIPLAQARHHNEYEIMTVARKGIAAAQAVLSGTSHREDRTQRLKAAGLEVSVTQEAMNELFRRRIGRRSLIEAGLFSMVHDPRIDDLRRKCRRAQRGPT